MIKFSVVMPIHNEEKYLVFSLPSIIELNPNEIILIFDRCTDSSLEVSRKVLKKYNYLHKTKIFELYKDVPEWNYRIAFLMRYGYRLANNDAILTTAADIILHKQILDHFCLLGKKNIALISFNCIQYPLNIQYFISKLISTFSPRPGFSGIFLFSKSAWLETEDESSVKKIRKAQDTHLRISIQKKYSRRHIWTNSIHLRPRENLKDHFWRGYSFRQVAKKPLWKAIFYSFIYFRPYMLVGYFYAKHNDLKNKIKYDN